MQVGYEMPVRLLISVRVSISARRGLTGTAAFLFAAERVRVRVLLAAVVRRRVLAGVF
jgi:hypothetical protein